MSKDQKFKKQFKIIVLYELKTESSQYKEANDIHKIRKY